MEKNELDKLFRRDGDQIFSESSGKLMAVIGPDGSIRIQQGFYSYRSRLESWLGGTAAEPEESAAEPAEPAEPEGLPEDEFAKDHTVQEGDRTVFVGGVKESGTGLSADQISDNAPAAADETLQYMVDTIPESALPPFTAELGVATPGFREFCVKNKIEGDQIGLLVRRLEKKWKKKKAQRVNHEW